MPERGNSGRGKRALGLSGAALLALLAGVVGAAGPAQAASSTFNPFDVNQGFTVVTKGDAYLNNSEFEGSIAVLGSISSGNQNGYPMIHQAAGTPDYVVPTIDGVPVRILADRFVGSGGFELSNRDDSHTISPTSPEATAVLKLADIAGLTGSARGGGNGPAAGTDFLRVTNSSGGILDLKTVPYRGSTVSSLKSEKSSAAAYFGELDAKVARANQCLASLYDPTLAASNQVAVANDGGMVFVSGFATDRPNVIDYSQIAGKTIKMDRANGYRPTASAPLIIRVAPGTTTLGQLRFEGWSSQRGAQQDLARYILLDLSQVTGAVSVDGLEMGAIWAPQASLNFSSGITTNGQWFAQNLTSAGGGEIHHHAFLGELPCASAPVVPVEPTPTETSPTVEPTPTETSTPVEPTPTPTETSAPVEPTPTETSSPAEPTPTPTETSAPVEPTPTETSSPVEPTPTETSATVEPTPTETSSPAEPTPTPTETSATPTATLDPEGGQTSQPTIEPTPTAPVDPAGEPTPTPTPTVDPTSTASGSVVPTVAPTTDVNGDPSKQLAFTGTDLIWPIGGGVIALLLGTGLLLITRPWARRS
ncbi:choice-of-anchor A domain-containing protein [Propionicimonas paludicola]|uniref:Choice-of-anchor A domain-containing protein n=1 Tax=Propionicimonas paludicola TaxID=185243 RepID=A0A2A9CRT1_9ACTN|nr:choice-of-anchor A domain-containing protein [Propionicimonas paludicola]